ncbi:hypothetical protein [Sphingomonas sp. Mn802worker]|uniref:hypothetical protein n=1 Tax=Sphingomonas sp. Mn802worker TaxID=629773 RepID=UPI001EE77CAC|nr:hypothetical protein [Sphingomonas sp. Mn802worker]
MSTQTTPTQTMYADADPRSRLATASAGVTQAAADGFGASSYALFGEAAPQIDDASGRTWITRGQNFIVAYTLARPGAVLRRTGQVDEYALLIEASQPRAVVTAGGEEVLVPGEHIAFIPPGDSSITLPDGGEVVRIFSSASGDLAALCSNAATYADPAPHIPPLERWPDPVGGFRIRSYPLNVAAEEGRFGRIWRCTTLMINVFETAGPRDPDKLSPHHHDDFEQGSLAMGGSFVHHLRWPWTARLRDWRDDEHVTCPAPSLAIIPARAVHTSASVAPSGNLLVDIFSPPRRDFSDMQGWVLNAHDYPAPSSPV